MLGRLSRIRGAIIGLGAFVALIAGIPGALAQDQAPVPKTGSARLDAMIAEAKNTMLTDPAVTVDQARVAEQAAEHTGSLSERPWALATTEWLQGEAHLRMNDVDAAAPLIDQAFRTIARDPRPMKLKGDILLSRGGIHSARANVAAALSDYHGAYKIFRTVGESRSQAVALLSIASLYRDAADYQSALKYYAQALDIYQGDPKFALAIYNNRGNMLNDMSRDTKDKQRYREGQAQLRKALVIAADLGSATLQARILQNISVYEMLAGDLDEASRDIARGLVLSRTSGDTQTHSLFLAYAAEVALARNDLGSSKRLIDKAVADFDLKKPTSTLRGGYVAAYMTYKRLGEDAKALAYLEAIKALDDQTAKLAASTNTALMAARFDYTNQNLKIAQLTAQDLQRRITYERSQAHFQRVIFIGAAVAALIVVALLVIGLLTIRRSRNQVRAANVDLAATNQALAKALAAKTEFLATTSHEIRTPLNGILGMTQVMLADSALPASTRDRLGVVHGAGLTMRALVDDILDVAKMETGNLAIEHAPMNACAILGDVARMWEEQARARGLEFVLDLHDCPACINGDAARLRQIVFNLLANALKFTNEGAITLAAKIDERDLGDPRVRISVSDTGIGIPLDKQDDIFESFRQADTSTTRQFGGTGLGLTICRNLARAMGGDIGVESVVGEGSTFTLDFPLLHAEEVDSGDDEVAAAGGLLIVDRNPITRSMLRALLESRAGSVLFAGTLEEAGAMIGRGGIDHVLIEQTTAQMARDYLAALAEIAQACRAGGAASALLWKGAEEAERATLVATGVDRVIDKPIAGPALLALLYPTNETKRDATSVPGLVSRAA